MEKIVTNILKLSTRHFVSNFELANIIIDFKTSERKIIKTFETGSIDDRGLKWVVSERFTSSKGRKWTITGSA